MHLRYQHLSDYQVTQKGSYAVSLEQQAFVTVLQ